MAKLPDQQRLEHAMTRMVDCLLAYMNARVTSTHAFGRVMLNEHQFKWNRHYSRFESSTNKQVWVSVKGWRNSHLTMHRFLLANNMIVAIRREVMGTGSVSDKLLNLQASMNTWKMGNAQLSGTYQKVHRSYQSNRAAGLSSAAAWWNKTWCQSGLNAALERCESILGTVEEKIAAEAQRSALATKMF